MNTAQIDRILSQHNRTRRYYMGTFAADQTPHIERVKARCPCALVVNTDASSQPGEHWVAVFIRTKSVAEYFDSLALDPPTDYLALFLAHFPTVITNIRPFQNPLSSVCGHYCIYFLIRRCSGALFFDVLKSLRAQTNCDRFVKHFVDNLFT